MAERHRRLTMKLNVWVSVDEYLKIRKKAERSRKTIREVVVESVLGPPEPEYQPVKFNWPKTRRKAA